MLRLVLLVLTAALAQASVSITSSSLDGPHPSTMELEVQLPKTNKKVRIPLTKTEAFENVPMTVAENGIERTFSARQLHHANHAHYRDIDTKSVISVRHVNGQKRISGHVMHEGVSYFLEPTGKSEHRVKKNMAKPDGIESQIDKKILRAVSRKKRQSNQGTTEYEVEIRLLADHTVWNTFKTIYGSDDTAMTEILYYYTHILNGMDTAFRNIGSPSMSVKCIGFTVAKNQTDAPWMPPAGSADTNNAGAILGYIRTYSKDKGADHVMAFTRTDIQSHGRFDISGMTYLSGACKESRQSIVEDQGLHSWGIASHELAHNLGSHHDNNEDQCKMGSKYLVTPWANRYNLRDVMNSYRFSPCTVRYIQNFINTGNANCLRSRQSVSDTSMTAVVREGSRMTLDQVCRLAFSSSPGKFFLTDNAYKNPAEICAEIFCIPKAGSSYGITSGGLRAPIGSPCGNKKSCNWNGECAADDAAPAVDEACFWGDSRGNSNACTSQ